jgi:hypothetical protein
LAITEQGHIVKLFFKEGNIPLTFFCSYTSFLGTKASSGFTSALGSAQFTAPAKISLVKNNQATLCVGRDDVLLQNTEMELYTVCALPDQRTQRVGPDTAPEMQSHVAFEVAALTVSATPEKHLD